MRRPSGDRSGWRPVASLTVNATVRARNLLDGQIGGTAPTAAAGQFSLTVNPGSYLIEVIDGGKHGLQVVFSEGERKPLRITRGSLLLRRHLDLVAAHGADLRQGVAVNARHDRHQQNDRGNAGGDKKHGGNR